MTMLIDGKQPKAHSRLVLGAVRMDLWGALALASRDVPLGCWHQVGFFSLAEVMK